MGLTRSQHATKKALNKIRTIKPTTRLLVEASKLSKKTYGNAKHSTSRKDYAARLKTRRTLEVGKKGKRVYNKHMAKEARTHVMRRYVAHLGATESIP